MTPFPVANVPYRIQSAETDTYLELRDVGTKTVLLQNLSDDNCLEQQWIFVNYNQRNRTHMIMNAATKALRHPRYLTVNSTTKKIVAITEDLIDDNNDDITDLDGVKSWLISEVTGEGVYTITCRGGKNREIFIFDDEERAGFIVVKASNDNDLPENRKWRILEVSGVSASITQASVSSASRDSAQTPEASAALATQALASMHSRLKNSALSQTPAASVARAPAAPSPPDYASPVPLRYDAVKCPEITAGHYKIRNFCAGKHLWWRYTNRPLVLSSEAASEVMLTYTSTSNGELTLSNGTSMVVSSGDNLHTSTAVNDWNRWVLERYDDGHVYQNGSPLYYICDSSDPQFVMSGDTKKDLSGIDRLIVAQKRPGYKGHLWTFEQLESSIRPASAALATFPETSVPSTSKSVQPKYDGPQLPRYTFNPCPEITNGSYQVQNVGTNEYFCWDSDDGRFYSDKEGNMSFELKYVNNSAEFIFQRGGYHLSGPQQSNDLSPPSIARMVVEDAGWPRWILDWHSDRNEGCCYYICDSRNPQIILSGDTLQHWEHGKDLFTIAQKRPGYEGHLWRFKK